MAVGNASLRAKRGVGGFFINSELSPICICLVVAVRACVP